MDKLEKNNNIEYYDQNASYFFEETVDADMSYWRSKFIALLPCGGRVLDAGCGSGRDSKAFIQEGFSVIAFDASRKMCKLASEYLSQEVWQMKFEEMSFCDEFDGVWACASLLHVPPQEMDSVLTRISKALQLNGVLYASFKYGDGLSERSGRIFTNYTVDTVEDLFLSKGFSILECEESQDVRIGRQGEKWVNVLARKK